MPIGTKSEVIFDRPPNSVTMSANQVPAWGGAAPCWGTPTTQPNSSFSELMDEEFAKELQEKEEKQEHTGDINETKSDDEVDINALIEQSRSEETSDDFLLAQFLQHEFDREHDKFLAREEQQCNGSSKVQISFKNYRTVHPRTMSEEEEEAEEVWEEDDRDDPVPEFNKAGFAGRGKNIVTKHDSEISGRKNAGKMEEFPPEFDTGDSRKIKVRLPNNVYNKLKRHSQQETKRSQKLHEKKEYSTSEMAVDSKTRLILYKLVNSGTLESIDGVVSTGKESVVFHGTGGSMPDELVPSECAIKVFKTTLSAFKNRCDYIRGDMRFLRDEYKKQNPRKIIKIWAEKELANLKKMESCGIPCPRAVTLKKNVLVMEFIGKDQIPAPKLHLSEMDAAQCELAYDQCIQNMSRMYHACHLVHADLSPYNMLWHNDTLFFIDVAQAVDIMHPHAMEFLLRDCVNVSKFFRSVGVHGVKNEYELFNEVTGLNLTGQGKNFLAQFEQFEKSEENLRMDKGKDYAFNYFFEKSQAEREERHKQIELLFEESDSDSELTENIALDPAIEEKLQLSLRLDGVQNCDVELPESTSVEDSG